MTIDEGPDPSPEIVAAIGRQLQADLAWHWYREPRLAAGIQGGTIDPVAAFPLLLGRLAWEDDGR